MYVQHNGIRCGFLLGEHLIFKQVSSKLTNAIKTHLNSGLAQMHLGGQLLANKGIRIVGAFEDLLQGRQLGGAEGGAIPARLPRVVATTRRQISGAGSWPICATASCASGACNQGAIKLGIFTFTFTFAFYFSRGSNAKSL